MFIIAGLGNPGKEYVNTRHNVGWSALDVFASKYGISVEEGKFKSLIGKGAVEGQKVILVKPLTYMNLSGEAVRAVCDYFKVDPENELIVLYDDISLPVGQLRVRPKGSAGGHNGIKNIIAHLGTEVFLRIKVGVGEKPSRMDLADYVLGHFSAEDAAAEKEAYEKVSEAILLLMEGKTEEAMNKFNRKVPQKEETDGET
ncbi:MAG: aminoacyl-tRNA hydrolase [Lachnospiraceae bacterium]|nr:aminoacyl-tRNA hydrolase [Lachnospiraceae bacterium]